MKVKELIEQLKKVDENKEALLANINIADADGNMPTFEINEVAQIMKKCIICFDDNLYIDENYSLTQ